MYSVHNTDWHSVLLRTPWLLRNTHQTCTIFAPNDCALKKVMTFTYPVHQRQPLLLVTLGPPAIAPPSALRQRTDAENGKTWRPCRPRSEAQTISVQYPEEEMEHQGRKGILLLRVKRAWLNLIEHCLVTKFGLALPQEWASSAMQCVLHTPYSMCQAMYCVFTMLHIALVTVIQTSHEFPR